MNDDYRQGYRDGFKDGFESASKTKPVIPNTNDVSNVCKVCGIDFGKKAWGYVCYNTNCPTGISCQPQYRL